MLSYLFNSSVECGITLPSSNQALPVRLNLRDVQSWKQAPFPDVQTHILNHFTSSTFPHRL